MERKTEFLIIRVTKTLKDELVKKAQNARLSLSNFVRQILDEKE